MPSPAVACVITSSGTQPVNSRHLHHRTDLASQLIGHRVIGLVDDKDVGDLHDAGLEHLDRIAAAGLKRDERRVRQLRDRNLALADADRLDEHDVETECIHEHDRIGGRAGEAAQMPAARHRSNEDGFVGEVLGQPDAIAEQRAVRKRRARIDRDDADALAELSRLAHQSGRKRRLSDARRPGQADRHCAPGPLVERANELGALSGLRVRDRARERPRLLQLKIAQQLVRSWGVAQGSDDLRPNRRQPFKRTSRK